MEKGGAELVANILNLPDWEIIRVEEGDSSYRIHARYRLAPAFCPGAGWRIPAGVHRFGKRSNVFADLPHHGKRTEMVVDRQRYRCTACAAAFLEPLPHMDEKQDATIRMVRWVEQQALRRPFTQVAEQVEVGEARGEGVGVPGHQRLY
jgi:transposase